MAAYRAEIEIGVRGSSRLKELQDRITRLSRSIEDVNAQTLIDGKAIQSIESYSTALGKASRNLREVAVQLDAAGRASGDYADAISQYITALGQSNAAQKLQNKLIADEIELRRRQKLAASGIRETTQYGAPIGPNPGSLIGTLAGQKSPVEERLHRIIQQRKEEAALQEGLLRLEQKSAEELNKQLELRGRLNREAAIAVGTTRQLVAEGNRAQQLLLAPARLGAPAMGGGARRRITGQVERLGGARTKDEAAAALRLAQNIKQQIQPLSQVEALYAGIAVEAAKMQRTKALPSSEMLNAAARGLQQIKTGQDRYNAELAESEERLNRIDRLEESRARRAKKLRDREEYFAPSTSVSAGVSRGGGRRGLGRLARRGPGRLANVALGAGFPLLFGGGPGAVLGGGLGGLVPGPGAFAAQIAFSAIGQQFDKLGEQAIKVGQALNPLTFDLSTFSSAAGIAGTKTEEFLSKIEQYAGKTEAAKEATKLLAARIGTDATSALKKFGEDAQKLGNQLSIIFTTVLANIARIVGPLIAGLAGAAERANLVGGFKQRAGLTGREAVAQQILSTQARGGKGKAGAAASIRALGQQIGLTGTTRQIIEGAKNVGVKSQKAYQAAQESALGFKAAQLEAASEGAKGAKKLANELAKLDVKYTQLLSISKQDLQIARETNPIKKLRLEEDKKIQQINNKYASDLEKTVGTQTEKIVLEARANEIALIRLDTEKRVTEEYIKQAAEYIKLYAVFSQFKSDLGARVFRGGPLGTGVGVDVGAAFGAQGTFTVSPKPLNEEKKRLEELIEPLNAVRTAARGVGTAFTDSFKSIIDGTATTQEALANLFNRIADAFFDMAAQIITQMLVIKAVESAIQIFGNGGVFKGFSGAGPAAFPSDLNIPFTIPGKAVGGPVSAGSPYVVGERGPELFVPGRSGTIVPNDKMGGSRVEVGTINISVENTGEQLSPAAQKQIANQVQGIVMSTLVNERRSGGVLR